MLTCTDSLKIGSVRDRSFLTTHVSHLGKRFVLVADPSLCQFAHEVAPLLDAQIFFVPRGELAKTREVKQWLEDELLAAHVDSESVLIALGGGATLDLAGFTAATYYRGIPLVFIPTSLLAMADAAIGGKNAINTHFGKNLIGSFYPPKAVLVDLDTLKTLPPKEYLNGWSEILKIGLVFDSEIFSQAVSTIPRNDVYPNILKNWFWDCIKSSPFGNRKHSYISNIASLVTEETREISCGPKTDFSDCLSISVLFAAIRAKSTIIAHDPLDRGQRRILNFGHTIGHALEKISLYTLPHGESVAIGCLAESFLSHSLGYLSTKEFEQIEKVYRPSSGIFRVSLPSSYSRKSCLEALSYDKKNRSHHLRDARWVIIDAIGHAHTCGSSYCRSVGETDVECMLAYMERIFGYEQS